MSALDAFALGLPAAWAHGFGDPESSRTFGDLALFAQDEWQVGPRVLLKLGVRYQRQFWPDSSITTNGFARPFPYPHDNDNVAPRLAATFDPAGDGRTSIHGAYGLFYDNEITTAATVVDIFDTQEGTRVMALRFPASVAAWNAPDHTLPEPPGSASTQFSIDPDAETPYARHASVGVNRELGARTALFASFVHIRGKNQLGLLDYNPLVAAFGPGRRPLDVNGVPGTSSSVLQFTGFGETWYRGLLLNLRRRFAGGYQLMASYTLSKAEDTSSDLQNFLTPQDHGRGRRAPDDTGYPVGFDSLSEKGPALNDQRHRFVLSGSMSLPGRNTLSAIVTAASGAPYNILAGADLDGNGDVGQFPRDHARTNSEDPATSLPRNAGRLPAQATVDLRVTHRIDLGDALHVDLIFEVFNLFNRANFTDVNNVFGTGTFPQQPLPSYGAFTGAGLPRQIQLSGKLSF